MPIKRTQDNTQKYFAFSKRAQIRKVKGYYSNLSNSTNKQVRDYRPKKSNSTKGIKKAYTNFNDVGLAL